MKTCEITTSKGEFVVMDMEHNSWFQNTQLPEGYTTERFIKLSEATEDDAKDVVDNHYWDSGEYYKDYIRICSIHRYCYTALESLHSLLKSKGIDVNNGNWYLFKKIL